MKNHDKAMVVLSGGQDSTTCLYWAKERFKEVHTISFDYGQRHAIELTCAAKIADMAGVSHEIVNVKGLLKSTSPLTSDTKLAEYKDFKSMEQEVGNKIEKTFVPLRNTLFLTVATNYALAVGASNVVTGICQEDNANYPDCTEQFRANLQKAINESLGLQKSFHRIHIAAPLMFLSKAATVRLAAILPGCGAALAYSHTSYDGRYPPDGKNHSNLLRAHGFEEAGMADPLVLRAWSEGLMELPNTENYNVARELGFEAAMMEWA